MRARPYPTGVRIRELSYSSLLNHASHAPPFVRAFEAKRAAMFSFWTKPCMASLSGMFLNLRRSLGPALRLGLRHSAARHRYSSSLITRSLLSERFKVLDYVGAWSSLALRDFIGSVSSTTIVRWT